MDLTTEVLVQVVATASKDFDLSTTGRTPLTFQLEDSLADGVGADQADLLWFDAASLGAGLSDIIDLNADTTDVYGDSLDFVRIKCLMFKNTSTTASVLEVGPHGELNGWPGPWTSAAGATGAEATSVNPDSGFIVYTPDATAWAVGAAATDDLEIFESSTLAALYEIVIVGATA